MESFGVPVFWQDKGEMLTDFLQGILVVLFFSWLFYDSFYAVPLLSPFILLWHKERAAAREQKKKDLFLKMFREWILLLSSSLAAGYSVENALGQSYKELTLMFPKGGIMLVELKDMLAKAENNLSPETLFMELAKKHPFDEVKSFVEVFCIARASGGSLNGVIRSTASRMAEIMDTRREIETFLSSKLYEQKIMTVMPAAVLLYVRVGSGDFLKGLYHNVVGAVVATVCLFIYLAAYLVAKRMVQFEI